MMSLDANPLHQIKFVGDTQWIEKVILNDVRNVGASPVSVRLATQTAAREA